MQKRNFATLLSVSLLVSAPAIADDLPISANISFVSDYAFRGVSQTDEKPALQGGLDFEHDSGFYLGVWGSNISWLEDAGADKSSLETNLYGGYATEVGPIGLDVGLLQYYYPGKFGRGTDYHANGGKDPDTLEGHIGLSWKFLSFTYSHAFSNLFGLDNSKGSKYYDLSAEYEIIDRLTLGAHYGYSDIRNGDNYKDWSLGATYAYGGIDFGLHYVDTNENDDLMDDRYIFSISKTF